MRARRREINIFNMSLLDILCGALGAFCFMMLVALPYYKPPGEEKKLREAQKETDRLLNEIAKMKDHMADQRSVEDLTELVRKLEAQIKLLQGEVNRLSAENQDLRRQVKELDAENKRLRPENERLRARNAQLEAMNQQLQAEKQQLEAQNQQLRAEKKQLQVENQELKGELAQKNPFLVLTSVTPANQSVAIFLSDQNLTQRDQKSPNAKFLPEAAQSSGWAGDRVGSMPGHGIGFWVTGSVIPKAEYKVYLKNAQPWFLRQACTLATTLFGDLADGTPAAALPEVTLTRDRYWTFLGTITIDDQYRPSFRVASAEEREAEWKAHATPTPAPSPSPGATYGPPIPTTATPTGTVSHGPLGTTPEERAFFDAMRHMREVMAMPNTEPGIEEKRREALRQMEETRAKMEEARRRQGDAVGPKFPFGPPAPGPSGSIGSPSPSQP